MNVKIIEFISLSNMHRYQDLITIFNACFAEMYNTRLVKGGEEPIYLPADEQRPYHAIFFAHGFFSSALHECSHWLIAGEQRRKLIDFGYWYAPDGRTASQQQLFQHVEAKPQALEWILSVATGYRFHLSIDNLNGEKTDTTEFKKAVYQHVVNFCNRGLTQRMTLFRDALCQFYGISPLLKLKDFNVALL